MRFDVAVENFIAEMRAEGRINSDHSEASYRSRLGKLGETVGNRDPRTIGFDEVARTLASWPNPSTGQHARSVYISFFDYCAYAGIRKDNPARATRPRKVRKPNIYRLSRAEVVALFDACETPRETRAIRLGCCAGLRNGEICGLQLRHFKREGAVWVSPDIAKGGVGRFVPVLAELEAVVADIIENVGEDDYVIAGRRPLGGDDQSTWREVPTLPTSPHALRSLVANVAQRAGIAAHIYPHLLRHAFGDHVARQVDVRIGQATLGHASVKTTADTYTGRPTLDELITALGSFRYDQSPSLPPLQLVHDPAVQAESDITHAPSSSAPQAGSPKEIPWPTS